MRLETAPTRLDKYFSCAQGIGHGFYATVLDGAGLRSGGARCGWKPHLQDWINTLAARKGLGTVLTLRF